MTNQNFSIYLSNNKTKKNETHTHTRIGDKKQIYGGSFKIKNEDEFYNNYYNNTFVNGKKFIYQRIKTNI